MSLSEIVAEAGVTKGALYHLFDSKAALFRAVLEQVQQEVAQTVAQTADVHDDLWTRLTAGCQAFLTASTAPGIQRIMLIDGPAVLGWNEWRAMDEAASARHLADVLTVLIKQGTIAPQPVAPLTHLLSGAMNEAALWLAELRRPRRFAGHAGRPGSAVGRTTHQMRRPAPNGRAGTAVLYFRSGRERAAITWRAMVCRQPAVR